MFDVRWLTKACSWQAAGVDEIALQMRTTLEDAVEEVQPGIHAALQSLPRGSGTEEVQP